MSNHNLFTLSADGVVVPASNETILTAARQVLAHRVRRGASLQSPQKAGEYLAARLGHLDYEVFGLILLDKRHRVIECIDLDALYRVEQSLTMLVGEIEGIPADRTCDLATAMVDRALLRLPDEVRRYLRSAG